MSRMTRRALVKVLAGGTVAAVVGCHKNTAVPDASPGPDAPAGCGASDAAIIIADNHAHSPHALVVTSADVQAAVDKTYDIMGTAPHNHKVTITAAQFATLKAGGAVMVTSTMCMPMSACVADHTHVCTISCG